MTTTLCGGCGNGILACKCKPRELAKPVEKEKRHGKSCGCKQCRAIHFGSYYGIGSQKLRDYALCDLGVSHRLSSVEAMIVSAWHNARAYE